MPPFQVLGYDMELIGLHFCISLFSFVIKLYLSECFIQQRNTTIKQKMQKSCVCQCSSIIQQLTFQDILKRITCTSQKQATMLCANEICSSPGIICVDESCQCREKHAECSLIMFRPILESIKKHQSQEASQEVKKSYQTVRQMIRTMIKKLSTLLKKLNFEEMYFQLKKQQLSFLSSVYEKRTIQTICGQFISELRKETYGLEADFTILSYEEIIKDFKVKQTEFDSLCKYIEKNYMKYNQKEIKKQLLSDSLIIKQNEERQLIQKWLSQTLEKTDFISKLLFRASEHNFGAKKFHEHCDGIQNTFVIVKTEFDKVIGGFTPQKWYSPAQDEWVNDKTGKSFLFSLTLKEKYKCVQPQHSIYCAKLCGPIFGNGADLQLSDDAFNNNGSYCEFPQSFNLENVDTNKYQQNQKTWSLFSGATESKNFKVKQYEVYQILSK